MVRLKWLVAIVCIMSAGNVQARLSCDEALAQLKAGNERFEKLETLSVSTGRNERSELAKSQFPFAAIVACSDSRLSPELVFNQAAGDLFVVRLAGNIIDDMALATLEYGVEELGVCLIVVLGHENCGAVKAAITMDKNREKPPGHIGELVDKIHPAVVRAKVQLPDATEEELLNRVIQDNAKNVAAEILDESRILRDAFAEGRLKIVAGEYLISTGRVNWLEES